MADTQEFFIDSCEVPIHGDDHCFTMHLKQMADALRSFFEQR